MWYFPLKPRLQRLFMSAKTASHMRWHADGRTNDGYMRHLADSPAWSTFDSLHPDFAKDCRNVRLGLASDGINPFKNMSVSHITWPVILIPYNLPPWMCMKEPYFMLSLLIPGPSAPGNDIDIYLQPLIAELKDLWELGVETYDASKKQNFQLRASLLWTIGDFLGYGYLSGWTTQGEFACPVCNRQTHSIRLKNGGKHFYMGHRKFLPKEHEFRKNKRLFDGTTEYGEAPQPLSGDMVMDELKDFSILFGKLIKDKPKFLNSKKKSIFFELPYWKDNVVRHNLDFMHTEKNICESICATLLGLDGKSKDNLKSRLDLEAMGIRPDLHPISKEPGKVYLPAAAFTMSRKEKTLFCEVLKKIKVPDGYASNISRSKPEGSIAQGYLAEECLTFCSLYLADYVESKFNRASRNEIVNDNANTGLDIFAIKGRSLGKGIAVRFDAEILTKAHQYVLFNCEPVRPYIELHQTIVKQSNPRVARHQLERIHCESFAGWL
ncbi:uncharacterized protein LOC131018523 [Salvia miltiorrhiza]|uniref:uncharacterized protein LOC131018523 n=1 Tax=Salvia miltiorrhiza TaxID=226208 RepID=UPI0025ABE8C9|nr:uncharacterized protein LOC131018523 [Salvia miltiorrhiza]